MKDALSPLRSVIYFPFNLIATPVDLVFCIPCIGRLTKWVWNIILTILHIPFGLIEWALLTKGFKPEKKLRLSIVVNTDENGKPVADPSQVVKQLEYTTALFKDKANILVQSAKLKSSSKPSLDWIYLYKNPSLPRVNRVGCRQVAIWEDLWLTGMSFQFTTLTQLFHTNFLRIIGYGSPVVVFVVEDIKGFLGCSLGPITDYVTVAGKGLICMAHEIGHACNLVHEHQDKENLMHPFGCRKTILTTKQIAFMRASRHVTFI
jgi:hypothetical protein